MQIPEPRRLLKQLSKIKIGEQTIIIVMSVIVGLLSGLANIIFRATMNFVHEIIFIGGSTILKINEGGLYKLLIPLLPITGALLLIPLYYLSREEVYGYGFPRFLERVNIQGGIIRFKTLVVKILSASFTIGSGGSAGVEGPIAQIGGACGSLVGQASRFSGNRIKLLIAAGSAGAIAATFNAPIAGVMFASEIVLLGNFALTSFAAIVVSSGIATVVSRMYYGENPIFMVPKYELVSAYEIPLYIMFGIYVGLAAVLYIRLFFNIKDRFDGINMNPHLKPALGALIIGIIGIFYPQILGDGYEFIEQALEGHMIFITMLALIFLKIIATSVTLGSGGSGGVFAPALFIGSMVGGSYGWIVHNLFPAHTASPGAYATVGVGAFLAASTHAPLTAMFLLFEMTGNYKIIIPIMLASIVSTIMAHRMHFDSIDTVELTRKGVNIHQGREASILNSIQVGSVMTREFTTVHEDTNIQEFLEKVVDGDSLYFPVVDDNDLLTGIISIQDIRSLIFEEAEALKKIIRVKNIIRTHNVIVVTADDTLNTAIEKFALKDIEEIPVVNIFNRKKLVGMIKRGDVISAYDKALLKRKI
jgi:CIC family chloride channel protein